MSGLRVAGGELRGRRLAASPDRSLRPTTERVREAIFSILGDVSGTRVLDVFCGTGALAIEALSRGAAHATLVDSRPTLARRNIEELGLSERAEVVRRDALRFLRADRGSYDLILCDPPYKLAHRFGDELGPLLASRLARGGRVIVETAIDRPLPVPLALERERRYGDTLVRLHTAEARP